MELTIITIMIFCGLIFFAIFSCIPVDEWRNNRKGKKELIIDSSMIAGSIMLACLFTIFINYLIW